VTRVFTVCILWTKVPEIEELIVASPLFRNPPVEPSTLGDYEQKFKTVAEEIVMNFSAEFEAIANGINEALPEAKLSLKETLHIVTSALVKRVQPRDTSVFNKFVEILRSEELVDQKSEDAQTTRMKLLNEHLEDFEEVAVRFSELIVSERSIPPDRKTVPESGLGEVGFFCWSLSKFG
jgi:hypothetical protein